MQPLASIILLFSLQHAAAFAPMLREFSASSIASRQRIGHVRCASNNVPPPPLLTGTQRRALRSHAGRLAMEKTLKYVNVADAERSREEVDVQLTSCELVRCKFAVDKKAEAKVVAAELATLTGAAVAEVLGHTALLYRPSAKKLIKLDK